MEPIRCQWSHSFRCCLTESQWIRDQYYTYALWLGQHTPNIITSKCIQAIRHWLTSFHCTEQCLHHKSVWKLDADDHSLVLWHFRLDMHLTRGLSHQWLLCQVTPAVQPHGFGLLLQQTVLNTDDEITNRPSFTFSLALKMRLKCSDAVGQATGMTFGL